MYFDHVFGHVDLDTRSAVHSHIGDHHCSSSHPRLAHYATDSQRVTFPDSARSECTHAIADVNVQAALISDQPPSRRSGQPRMGYPTHQYSSCTSKSFNALHLVEFCAERGYQDSHPWCLVLRTCSALRTQRPLCNRIQPDQRHRYMWVLTSLCLYIV
jgi:hypothetical protein